MRYLLYSEPYVMPAASYKGHDIPEIRFQFAIRRSDGSLVYRTEQKRLANAILRRLGSPQVEMAA